MYLVRLCEYQLRVQRQFPLRLGNSYHVSPCITCILIRATCCYVSSLHWETRIRNGWTWKLAGIAIMPISQDSINGPGADLLKLSEEASFNEKCWKWLLQQFFFPLKVFWYIHFCDCYVLKSSFQQSTCNVTLEFDRTENVAAGLST